MITDLDSVLEECLDRLAEGETLQACLAYYPECAAELKPLLVAATQLKNHAQLRPSPLFKARARQQLYAHMDTHPRRRPFLVTRVSPLFRLALGLAAVLLAFATTGVALAQFSLPGDMLYAWKLGSESAWRAVSPDPVGVDLDLGNRRIDEALAVSRNATAQGIALNGYQSVVNDLTRYTDSSVQERITAGLRIHQERLKDAGLKLPNREDLPAPAP
jgi:hypothetical protein